MVSPVTVRFARQPSESYRYVAWVRLTEASPMSCSAAQTTAGIGIVEEARRSAAPSTYPRRAQRLHGQASGAQPPAPVKDHGFRVSVHQSLIEAVVVCPL